MLDRERRERQIAAFEARIAAGKSPYHATEEELAQRARNRATPEYKAAHAAYREAVLQRLERDRAAGYYKHCV